MAVHIVRYRAQSSTRWGVVRAGKIHPLAIDSPCTADLITDHRTELLASADALASEEPPVAFEDAELLSPVTNPRRVLCQGANYRQHIIDSGGNPDDHNFNMFFNKSTAAVCGPRDALVKPSHVKLLDYEVELALVLAREIRKPVKVTEATLFDYVAGICVANDYSARDVQIPQMQFFKGKSYRTFCPVGPVLCLLAADEMHYLADLLLTLRVNGESRQHDTTNNLLFKPAETLTELSGISDFDPGDLVLTGTPSGCALAIPSPALVKVASVLPERLRWKMFLKTQARRSEYLSAGDVVESEITSSDGQIQLGLQRNVVTDELGR